MDIESELKKVGVGRVRRFLDAFRAYAALSPDTLDDKNLNILCGLRRDQLNSIAELSKERKEKVFQLFVFLRLGVGQRPVAALLGKNQSTVSRQFNDTLPKVEKVMAAKYLRQSRATILSGVSALVKALFPELFAAIDGTYHEVEKSQRMMEQLKSWNKQKGYNLLKTLTLITADGKWWDFLGLFYSDGAHNDEMMWVQPRSCRLQDHPHGHRLDHRVQPMPGLGYLDHAWRCCSRRCQADVGHRGK